MYSRTTSFPCPTGTSAGLDTNDGINQVYTDEIISDVPLPSNTKEKNHIRKKGERDLPKIGPQIFASFGNDRENKMGKNFRRMKNH